MGRKSKGQTTIELLILLVVSLIALAIIYSLYAQQLEISGANQNAFMAKSVIQKIVTSANALALSGAGAETKIEVDLPEDLDFENSGFEGKTVYLRLDTGSDLVGVAEVDLDGFFREVEGKQFLYLYYDGSSVKIHYNDFEVNKKNISIAATQGTIVTESFTIRNNYLDEIDFVLTPNYSHSDVSLQIDSADLSFTLQSKEVRSIDINFVISSSANGNYSGSIDIVGTAGSDTFTRTLTLSAESYFVLSEILLFPRSVTFSASPNSSIVEDFSICNSSDNPISITSWSKDGNAEFSAEDWFTLPSINSVGANSCEEFDINFNIPQLYVSGTYDTNITANLNDGNSYTSYVYFVVNYVDSPYFSFRSVTDATLIPNFNSSFFLSTRIDANNFDNNRIVPSGELDTNLLQRNDYGSGTAFSKTGDQNYLVDYFIDSNLEGLWHLDGSYIDSSGKMRHATCSSCPTIASGLWDTNALEFNGSSNDLTTSSFSLDANNFTISAWVYADSGSLSSRRTIFQSGAGEQPQLEIGSCNGKTKAVCAIKDGIWMAESVNNVIDTDAWYYIVYTKNGLGATNNLYVNGVKVSLVTNSSLNYSSSVASVKRIGSRSATQLFDGKIEEVSVFSRTLTAGEIKERYDYLSSIINQNKEDIIANSNLVGFWRFNDKNSSNYILNSKTGNRDGLLSGGADVNAVGLKDTNAGFFDGSNDYVLLQNLNVDTSAGAKNTVSFWMKWNGVAAKMPFSWNSQYDLFFNGGCFGFNTYQANVFGIPSTGLENNWVHVVAVFYNGVPDAINNSLYINGVKQNIYACYGSTTASKIVNSSARIGGGFDGYYLRADIEDFAIWNKELSQEEVTQIYDLQKPAYLDGIVSLWKFDDKNSSNYILNSRKFIYDGQLVGNATTTAQGLWDTNAISLDGSGDYVDAGTNTILGASPFTLAAWINTTKMNVYQGAISIGASSTANGAYIGTVNTAQAGVSNSIGGGFFGTNYGSGITTINVWVHVALVYDGAVAKIYVDGVEKVSANYTANLTNAYTRIGRIGSSTLYDFNGKVDEATIWNRALSASEISELYYSQAGEFSEPNLVGLWHMDDVNAEGYVLNSATGLRDIRFLNGANTNTNGLFGTNSAYFDGVNDIAHLPNISVGTTHTISMWIYPEPNVGTWTSLFALDYDTGLYYMADSKKISFYYSAVDHLNNTELIENSWNHIMVTNNNGEVTFYVNGVRSGTASAAPAYIANRMGNDSFDEAFKGKIEEVTLWGTVLSQSKIKELYEKQKGEWLDQNLVAYYKFNESSGTTIFDSARGNSGTLVSTASINVQGLWDSHALSLNGTSDYVSVDSTDFKFESGEQDFSVSVWVKPNSVNSRRILALKDADNDGWRLLEVGGVVWCSVDSIDVKSSSVLKLGVWQNVVCTIDRSGNGQIYINGVADGSPVAINGEAMDISESLLRIGASTINFESTSFFDGLIDEIKIYDRVLTPEEILADYNSFLNAKFVDSNLVDSTVITQGTSVFWDSIKVNSKVGYDFGKEIESWSDLSEKGINELGAGSNADYLFSDENLLALWHFNDKNSQGWLLNSATGLRDANLNNGADVNAQGLWDTNAGFFDGANDYVNISGLNNMTNGSMTFSAWIYRDEYSVRDVVFGSYSQANNINFEIYSDNFMRIWWNNGQIDVRGTYPIPSNKWVLYTIVRNVSENKFYSYIDGELKNTFDGVGSNFVTNNQYFVGKDVRDGTTAFKGKIDEVAIWSRALTQSEVSDLYNSQKPMFQNGLVGLWHLNNNAIDSSSLKNFTVTSGSGNVEVLVVAGGGGGGSFGAGGGAGGLIYNSEYAVSPQTYPVVVGSGGAGAITSDTGVAGLNGSDSVFGALTAIGGGGGGTRFGSSSSYHAGAGRNGGSGGGSSMGDSGAKAAAGTGVAGQGYGGGQGYIGVYRHGGGGGAGAVGADATSTKAGDGGVGLAYSIRGSSVYYAGGGGGGIYTNGGTIGTGGLGGGGNGASTTDGVAGTPNTGGGGGGGGYTKVGGKGGSGIVIVRYPTGSISATGGTITTDGNYTIHTFTNVNNGVWSGTESYSTGLFDTNAAYFNGLNSYIDLGNPSSLNNLTNFSISLWLNTSNCGEVTNGRLLSKRNSSGFGWDLSCASGKALQFYRSGSTATNAVTSSLDPFPYNSWIHLVVTVNNNYPTIFINGFDDTNSISRTSGVSPSSDSSYLLYVGRAYGATNADFDGKIEELAIWNRVLTTNEIKDLYRKGVSRLDLNVYSCVDSLCQTKNSSQFLTSVQNGVWYPLTLPDSNYLGYEAQFNTQNIGDSNVGNFWVGSFLQDVNIFYRK